MKSRIKLLSFFSLLITVVLIFYSCEKEQILPLSESDKTLANLSINETDKIFDYLSDTADVIDDELNTLENVMASIEFEKRTYWDVSIKVYTCINESNSLLVYNANHPNLDFYNSERFLVLWFKNGKPLRRATNRIECICSGEYAVVVINRATKQGVGIAFFTGRSCDSGGHQNWDVSIKVLTCINNASTLIVYNKYQPDLDYYDSNRFVIFWYKNNEPIRGTNRLECVCGGKYIVVVYKRGNGEGIGKAYQKVDLCIQHSLTTVDEVES